MSEPKLVRPPQVTVAGWLVVAGSVAVVLMAFSQVARLRTLETRESLAEFLSKPPGDAFDLGVQDALSVWRIALMVAAACAAASAILGWQVLQRSRGARVALSALALPLFVSGLVSGGVVAAIVVAAIVMLWFQPARDWFDGVAYVPPARPAPTKEPARDTLRDLPPPPAPPIAPPSTPPAGPSTAPPLHPTPYATHPGPATGWAAPTTRAEGRPAAVAWACGITWGCCVAVALLFAGALLQVAVAPEIWLDEWRRQNPELDYSDAYLTRFMVIVFVVCLVWSLVAAGLALLVWRRSRWAAVALGVSAAAACLTLLPVVACVATVVLLLRPESRQWFAGPPPARRGPLGP
jgi:hypothetical protein